MAGVNPHLSLISTCLSRHRLRMEAFLCLLDDNTAGEASVKIR